VGKIIYDIAKQATKNIIFAFADDFNGRRICYLPAGISCRSAEIH
jgi:Mor family transcriptional regulator